MATIVKEATAIGKRTALAEINTHPKLAHDTWDGRDNMKSGNGTRRNSRRSALGTVTHSDRLPRPLNQSQSSQNVSEKTGHIPECLITPINKNYRVSYEDMKRDNFMKGMERALDMACRPPRMPKRY